MLNLTDTSLTDIRTILRSVKHGLGSLLDSTGILPPGSNPFWNSKYLSQIKQIMANSGKIFSSSDAHATDGARILFITKRAWLIHMAWESTLAWAVRLRGAQSHSFSCSGGLPICHYVDMAHSGPLPCTFCSYQLEAQLRLFKLPHSALRDYISLDEMQRISEQVKGDSIGELRRFEYKTVPVGNMAGISASWHLGRADISTHERALPVLRDFITTGSIMVNVGERLFERIKPDVVVILNGMLVTDRVLMELARRRGVPVVTYERGWIADTLLFARNEPANRADIEQLGIAWRDGRLTGDQNRVLDEYLAERRTGGRCVVDYWPSVLDNRRRIVEDLSLDPTLPIVTLFSNLEYDTAVLEMDIGFDCMFSWLTQVVEYASRSCQFQLIIRIHPAEARLPKVERADLLLPRILAAFPELPPWIKVVPPESPISSYSLVSLSEMVLVYSSTIGLEAALSGKPVVVAAEVHYRGKGFTYDVTSPADLISILSDPASCPPVSELQIDLARRYSYSFFFRFMMPFDLVREPVLGYPQFEFQSLEDLKSGRHKALDVICDALLGEKPFALP
jgi:hypothetical protein